MHLRSLVMVVALAVAGRAHADPVDSVVLAEMKRMHIPGVSLVVVRNGKIVKERGYGLANVEHRVPVTPATVFQSGSVGKQFTAALVLLLAQDGKLDLDDPISRHLANTPKAWEGITVRHLLTHTSGLADPYDKLDLRKDYTDEELIAIEATIPILFGPGEAWSYSNMGYHLLGFICNKVGGTFYGDQLRERIFAPIGMGSRIISERDIVPHRAAGYDWSKGELKNQAWVAPRLNTTADGSLYVTARDLALWDLALYRDTPLSAALKEASWTPVKLKDGSTAPYGFGWQLAPVNGHRSIAHGGSWQGFRTQISRYVDDRLTVIVLANLSSARPERIANLVAAHYVPALALQPAKPIPDTEPEVAAQVRALVGHLTAGSLPPDLLSTQAAAILTAERLANLQAYLGELGPVRSVALVERTVTGESRAYRYRYAFRNETLLVSVAYDKAGRVEKLNLRAE